MLRKMIGAGMGGLVLQAANLAALPVISRLYGSADIGIWAIWLGAATIVGTVASLRYELGIVVARSEAEADALVWLSASLVAALSALFLLACAIPAVQELVGGSARVSLPLLV